MNSSRHVDASCTDTQVAEQLIKARDRLLLLQSELTVRFGKKANDVMQCTFVQRLKLQQIHYKHGTLLQIRVIGRKPAIPGGLSSLFDSPGSCGYILAITGSDRICLFRTWRYNERDDESVIDETYDTDEIGLKFPEAAAWCFETLEAALTS